MVGCCVDLNLRTTVSRSPLVDWLAKKKCAEWSFQVYQFAVAEYFITYFEVNSK